MSATLWVDPNHFRTVAPRFGGLADTADALIAELTSALDAEGAAWGSDEGGTAFAGHYIPGAESAVHAVASLVALFSAIGDGMRATAESFEATETRFSQELGGAF
ncbi:WXG100 family type VII secretion target [Rhodococcus tibetensis]|uniref:WXG100 family type VII secretion target n=1 Tax=Rhodococcus tibetensis TaxID=2965064 RepID=A0ABT1QDV0_9NOCA|nr:WXG100 family type VII secretion target [Rhodococcus sp. FXJ9.536]MCQ4120425.1 WXG100 family type VII secretion target [Rhodococcus sp. FXJ9.536]